MARQPFAERVLVVEDDEALGAVLKALLEQEQFVITIVTNAEAALKAVEQAAFDVVLSDVRLPGNDGLWLLDHVLTRYADIPVVMMTAHGSVANAVEAMRRGAADYVQKPFEREEIVFVLKKALLASQRARTLEPVAAPGRTFLGESAALAGVLERIRKVATSTATVLVRGESGTGKELVARAIHEASHRAKGPFVAVHCGALPEALLESELFGYEKGAFTGAVARKVGRVELAHGGTLFLDEIGDISPVVQVKLLRVLQERAFERVGGTETVRVDVRFIAATHRDLEAMVESGTFREDLFYRLNVVPVVVPPLRERPADVAMLAHHFASVSARDCGRPHVKIAEDAMAILAVQPWPGNVRQLQNFVERLIVLADGAVITRADIETELVCPGPLARAKAVAAVAGESLEEQKRRTEHEALVEALGKSAGNRTLAARLLGVSRRTLYNKLEEYGLASEP